MRKILAIAGKELYIFFRDRNLILLSFATPLVLSTIIGLAFGGGGGSDSPEFAEIAVAVVNLDEAVDVQEVMGLPDQFPDAGSLPFDFADVTIPFGDSQVTLASLLESGSALNFGDQIAGILLSRPVGNADSAGGAGLDFGEVECRLLGDGEGEESATFAAGGTLDDLLDASPVADPDTARAGVDSGEYAAAVIIPPDFSRGMLPRFLLDGEGRVRAELGNPAGTVEVYGNDGRPISARVVHAITTGIVNQFVRVSVALSATVETSANVVLDSDVLDNIALANIDTGAVDVSNLDLSGIDLPAALASIQGLDASVLEPLFCLITPGASNISVNRQPLDALQEAPTFARLIVPIGASQAVFFALFTGVFGIHSIYEERRNWTLQRVIVSPTPRFYLLVGKVAGNLVTVLLQILILLAALTVVATIVIGETAMIWGTNGGAVLAVVAALALCVSGVGVFLVGLARTPEQVVMFGPLINIGLAVLGGAFGFSLPEQAAQFSLIYWGVDAFIKLASGQTDIALNLLVLVAQGLVLFLVGMWLFKRRLDL